MRYLIAVMLLFAIPTFATAQQADAVEVAPTVQLEQSTTMDAPAATDVERTGPVEMETRDAPVEQPAAMQEPGTNNWWWIVGAVVVGGLIVVLLT